MYQLIMQIGLKEYKLQLNAGEYYFAAMQSTVWPILTLHRHHNTDLF